MKTEAEFHDPRGRPEHWEGKLVWEYFRNIRHGFFVEVGANHPKIYSQTYFLEQQGWNGILIEPNPKLCRDLREQRPRSQVFETAVCAPSDVGEADLHLGPGRGGHSAIKLEPGVALAGECIRVPMKTLDRVLEETHMNEIDFISLDVEGMELDVLRGFDMARWQPSLLLIEDFFVNHEKHKYLKCMGYKLIRRTGYDNWYVPQKTAASLLSVSTSRELFRLARKFWLNPPYETVRRKWKQRNLQP
ncbi:MAG: FkbM family methyltransferase [Verrucomicrobiia bacterium]